MSGVLLGAADSSVIDVSATSTWPLLPLIAARGCPVQGRQIGGRVPRETPSLAPSALSPCRDAANSQAFTICPCAAPQRDHGGPMHTRR